MEKIKIRIEGTRPLLLHAPTSANPLHPLKKEYNVFSGKRKKTDDDYAQMAKLQWRMGLYYDEKNGVYLPGHMIEASIVSGGKKSKLGKVIKENMEVLTDKAFLEYEGPKKMEKLWEKGFYDARIVRIGQSRIIAYRPLFLKWAAEFEILFDESNLNKTELMNSLKDAGLYCGVGDYRPKFGRYNIKEIN